MAFTIGIDMGGTNTDIGIVNEHGKCIDRNRLATSTYSNIDIFVSDLVNSIHKLLEKHKIKTINGIGIGAPNANFYTGEICKAPNLKFEENFNLKKLIKNQIDTKVVITNDANAAAYGEMFYGGAKNIKNFIMITLGTGVGSGIVIDGKVVYGHDGMAGELGHTIIFPDGRQCTCGRKGCLETYASARGIKQTCHELLAEHQIESELYSLPVGKIGGKVIGDAADRGDALAVETLRQTGYVLGLALSNAVACTSPEAIFLMGGPTKSGDLLSPTKYYLEKFLLASYQGKVQLLLSQLNENTAAILGAAALLQLEEQN
ncbi:MAG TPA: ROK family protein [Bacteroidales bacterium]|jgi:glucokinase|nr:ROK family protein [Bacteroidales bacterium]